MRKFVLEHWDGGRLIVNRDFAPILRRHCLATFDALMQFQGGRVAKNLLPERTTTKFVLTDDDGERALYIKRHGPAPWKEYVKPLLRLTLPVLGARAEWNAMIRFHAVGIPTMTPVALGESGRLSFVVTEAIEGCTKLSHWMETHRNGQGDRHDPRDRELVDAVARLARTMHGHGMHHQDFYLTHLLAPRRAADGTPDPPLYIIDLGRVRRFKRRPQRWIVKDLAQLNYSAGRLTQTERFRFLRAYLDRPLQRRDLGLIRRIARKSAAIARHSRRNRL